MLNVSIRQISRTLPGLDGVNSQDSRDSLSILLCVLCDILFNVYYVISIAYDVYMHSIFEF